MAQTRPREIFGPYDDVGGEETAGHIHGVRESQDELAVIKRKRIERERPWKIQRDGWVVRLRRERDGKPRNDDDERERRKRLSSDEIQEETEAHERLTTGESGEESPEASRTT